MDSDGKPLMKTPASPPPRRASALARRAAPEVLGDALRAAFSVGSAAWPELPLSPEVFASFLLPLLVERADPAPALGALHIADLYLVCAFIHGVPGAGARLNDYLEGLLDEIAKINSEKDEQKRDELFAALKQKAPTAVEGVPGGGGCARASRGALRAEGPGQEPGCRAEGMAFIAQAALVSLDAASLRSAAA